MKQRLETVIEMEDGLPPLSRADADIVLLPDYVKDAIDSLDREVNTFIPKCGVYGLMCRNIKRLRYSESIERTIRVFKAVLINTPTKTVTIPFNPI